MVRVASAFVAFGCYTLCVAWGILLSARSWKPAAAQFVYHRFLSSRGVVAVATHPVTLMLDHYTEVGPETMIGRDHRPGVAQAGEMDVATCLASAALHGVCDVVADRRARHRRGNGHGCRLGALPSRHR
jgi:hypothetical protein